eukprot:TRINITY_DN2027_c0_g1_i1.p1 TRINITY_DN2027_c0_g1~~TRINITY_DN2027_c0_g1_i1.p1  ORF type:complete len:974 (-),score=180.30 TRINITY_DN2027_c0_g1_i1:208-3129(-)
MAGLRPQYWSRELAPGAPVTARHYRNPEGLVATVGRPRSPRPRSPRARSPTLTTKATADGRRRVVGAWSPESENPPDSLLACDTPLCPQDTARDKLATCWPEDGDRCCATASRASTRTPELGAAHWSRQTTISPLPQGHRDDDRALSSHQRPKSAAATVPSRSPVSLAASPSPVPSTPSQWRPPSSSLWPSETVQDGSCSSRHLQAEAVRLAEQVLAPKASEPGAAGSFQEQEDAEAATELPLSPRRAAQVCEFAREVLQDLSIKNATWNPQRWKKAHDAVARTGDTHILVPLLRSVQFFTDQAVADRRYTVLTDQTDGRGNRILKVVDMTGGQHPFMNDVPGFKLFGRLNTNNPKAAGPLRPVRVRTFCPLDMSIDLYDTGRRMVQSPLTTCPPLVLVVEVLRFDQDGLIDLNHSNALAPHDMLLRSDFAKFVRRLNDHMRQIVSVGQPSLQHHLTSLHDPYMVRFDGVTIFRKPWKDGYGFLSRPIQVDVILTAFPVTTAPVMRVAKERVGFLEWYQDQNDESALLQRMDLLGRVASQRAEGEDGQLPILMLPAPGSGGTYRQPREAVASALKNWRWEYSPLFSEVFLLCRGRGCADVMLADFFDKHVNADKAVIVAARPALEASPEMDGFFGDGSDGDEAAPTSGSSPMSPVSPLGALSELSPLSPSSPASPEAIAALPVGRAATVPAGAAVSRNDATSRSPSPAPGALPEVPRQAPRSFEDFDRATQKPARRSSMAAAIPPMKGERRPSDGVEKEDSLPMSPSSMRRHSVGGEVRQRRFSVSSDAGPQGLMRRASIRQDAVECLKATHTATQMRQKVTMGSEAKFTGERHSAEGEDLRGRAFPGGGDLNRKPSVKNPAVERVEIVGRKRHVVTDYQLKVRELTRLKLRTRDAKCLEQWHDWEDARRSREVKADEEATQRLLDRETLQAVCEAEAAKFVALTTSLASGKYAPSPSHHGVRVHASRRRSGV